MELLLNIPSFFCCYYVLVALDDSVQHQPKSSSSLLSAADPTHKASAKILVSVGGADKKADVLGLASYASDDDDADTDAGSNADVDGSDGVESHGMGSRNDVTQQPSADNPPEPKATVDTRLNPEVVAGDVSPNNNKSGLDQMLGSRRNSFSEGKKNVNISASSGDTSGCRTVRDKEAILDQPHRKTSGLESDCNLRKDSNKSSGKDLSDDLSRDRSRGDEMKSGKEKGDSQNGSKDRVKQDMKSAEEVKGFVSNKKSTDLDVKKDSKDAERPHRTNSKEDRGKKREKEKEERSRHRHSQDSSKDKRRRSPTSNESSDDSIRWPRMFLH